MKPRTLNEYFAHRRSDLDGDLRDAVQWGRWYAHPDPSWSPELRRQVEERFIEAVVTTMREARASACSRVASAVERAATERRERAGRYGRDVARDLMRRAGFTPEDYEQNRDDLADFIRAEVRRQLIELGLEDLLYESE
jgi:hypothetical protein